MPRPRSAPPAETTFTTSPVEKRPSALVTPTGSTDAPRSRIARLAPASSTTEPRGISASPIQSLRALSCWTPAGASNLVPSPSPSMTRLNESRSRPRHTTMGTPAAIIARAARTFDAMPPVPTAEPAPPAIAEIWGVTSSTRGTRRAVGSLAGFAVYRPSMSERITYRSAFSIAATMAPSMSLSPKLISVNDTVSFSFTTGTAPSSSILPRVFRAFR